MTPKQHTENFFETFAPKKVGGGEMYRWLIKKFDRYGKMMFNKGFEAGREAKEKVYSKGYRDGKIQAIKELK